VELSFLTKLRITAVIAAGALLIGILAWPLAKPADPFGVVSLVAGNITCSSAITLVPLAFVTGLLAFFISWPYGQRIGVLAVPSGLAVWAIRSGNVAELMRQNYSVAARHLLFASLKWESFYWLALVAAGFLGVLLAQKITRQKTEKPADEKHNSRLSIYLNGILALAISVVFAKLCLAILAQDVHLPDDKLGSVVVQLIIGQIVFAVLVSFGLVAFAVKKFLNADYIWPTIATALLHPVIISIYLRPDLLQYLSQRWPAVIFSNPLASILPVQMVAFGALGSIAGYWLAVRYDYCRKHES
jgi:hypothetical protein